MTEILRTVRKDGNVSTSPREETGLLQDTHPLWMMYLRTGCKAVEFFLKKILVKLSLEKSWIAALNSGKMKSSLSFTNVAEGILIILQFWILFNVSHTCGVNKICDN